MTEREVKMSLIALGAILVMPVLIGVSTYAVGMGVSKLFRLADDAKRGYKFKKELRKGSIIEFEGNYYRVEILPKEA